MINGKNSHTLSQTKIVSLLRIQKQQPEMSDWSWQLPWDSLSGFGSWPAECKASVLPCCIIVSSPSLLVVFYFIFLLAQGWGFTNTEENFLIVCSSDIYSCLTISVSNWKHCNRIVCNIYTCAYIICMCICHILLTFKGVFFLFSHLFPWVYHGNGPSSLHSEWLWVEWIIGAECIPCSISHCRHLREHGWLFKGTCHVFWLIPFFFSVWC